MSTLYNTWPRLLAWIRSHVLIVVAAVLFLAFVVLTFVVTYRTADERQARLNAVQNAQIDFCVRGNVLRSALRDYLHQTVVVHPIPPDLDPAAAADLQARNQAAQEALDRGDRSFAAIDCHVLSAQLHSKGTP